MDLLQDRHLQVGQHGSAALRHLVCRPGSVSYSLFPKEVWAMSGDSERASLSIIILLGIRAGVFAPFLIFSKAGMWEFAGEAGLISLLIAVPLLVRLSERRSR